MWSLRRGMTFLWNYKYCIMIDQTTGYFLNDLFWTTSFSQFYFMNLWHITFKNKLWKSLKCFKLLIALEKSYYGLNIFLRALYRALCCSVYDLLSFYIYSVNKSSNIKYKFSKKIELLYSIRMEWLLFKNLYYSF